MSRDVFSSALIRERKRADRVNESVVLVTLASGVKLPPNVWRSAIKALATATREVDVVGWLEDEKAVGVILTDIQSLDLPFGDELENRIRRELAERLPDETASQLSMAFYAHPHAQPAAQAAGTVTPLPARFASRPRAAVYDALKRALDVTASLALLGVLSPLLLIVAALVKLTSRGPVFFRQVRVGYESRSFTMLKFRTMQVNADHALHKDYVTNFITAGSSGATEQKGFFKIANDPRVTSIGRFLRKTSIDELPQLWNVVRGDMSLVGPRPPLQYEVDKYQPWHRRRLMEAKPGLTGLWQVAGRSRTTFDEMVRLDLRYARSCSLSTDLRILLATPGAVIAGKGAC